MGWIMSEWVSVKDRLPPVDWNEMDGVKCWSPRLVLLKRRLESRGAVRLIVEVGEYGEDEEWKVWKDFVNEQGYEDCDSWVVENVTHWMEIPDFPDEERYRVRVC